MSFWAVKATPPFTGRGKTTRLPKPVGNGFGTFGAAVKKLSKFLPAIKFENV
jgi:hypothetical protein